VSTKWYNRFKDNRTFLMCAVSIVGVIGLNFYNGLDISILLPTIIGIYATSRTTQKVSAHYNARQDTDSDLDNIIKTMDNSETE
jgi:hypothetical protein